MTDLVPIKDIGEQSSHNVTSPRVSMQLMDEFLEARFSRIDENKSSLTPSELKDFIAESQARVDACGPHIGVDSESTSINASMSSLAKDLKVGRAVRDLQRDISKLSTDWTLSRDVISNHDLREFRLLMLNDPDGKLARHAHYAMLKDEHDKDRFFDVLGDIKPGLDSDQDGYLRKSELALAMNGLRSSESRTIAKFLHDHHDELSVLGSRASSGYYYGGFFPAGDAAKGIGPTQLSNLRKILNGEEAHLAARVQSVRLSQLHGGLARAAAGGVGLAFCSSMALEAPRGRFKYAMIGASLLCAEATRRGVMTALDGAFGTRGSRIVEDCRDQSLMVRSWRFFY